MAVELERAQREYAKIVPPDTKDQNPLETAVAEYQRAFDSIVQNKDGLITELNNPPPLLPGSELNHFLTRRLGRRHTVTRMTFRKGIAHFTVMGDRVFPRADAEVMPQQKNRLPFMLRRNKDLPIESSVSVTLGYLDISPGIKSPRPGESQHVHHVRPTINGMSAQGHGYYRAHPEGVTQFPHSLFEDGRHPDNPPTSAGVVNEVTALLKAVAKSPTALIY